MIFVFKWSNNRLFTLCRWHSIERRVLHSVTTIYSCYVFELFVGTAVNVHVLKYVNNIMFETLTLKYVI